MSLIQSNGAITTFFSKRVVPGTGRCYGCAQPLASCPSPLRARQEFRTMTGLHWPGAFVTLNLHTDFSSLGLDVTDIPESGNFCVVCCVGYMKEFNRLHRHRPGRPGRPR